MELIVDVYDQIASQATSSLPVNRFKQLWLIASERFALHTDFAPPCNQRSNVSFGLQTDYEQKSEFFEYQNVVPFPTASALISRNQFWAQNIK